MPNSVKSQTKVVGTTIDAMIKEGKALGRIWKQTNSLKDSAKASGFDTRLGKLLQQLKASSPLDSGQISRQTLTTHGVHVIDRRRRAEALWFVENEVECRDFMKASKKGFTSLTALQAAMRKSAKADNEAPTTKVEPSNVGQSDDTPAKAEKEYGMVSKQLVFDKLVKVCDTHGIDMLEIAEMIIDHSTAPTVTEVAA
tara:strand:+ start:706 stop:1299 length:594 start_codon:yes stop_codon:yes gene_type:complete